MIEINTIYVVYSCRWINLKAPYPPQHWSYNLGFCAQISEVGLELLTFWLKCHPNNEVMVFTYYHGGWVCTDNHIKSFDAIYLSIHFHHFSKVMTPVNHLQHKVIRSCGRSRIWPPSVLDYLTPWQWRKPRMNRLAWNWEGELKWFATWCSSRPIRREYGCSTFLLPTLGLILLK